MWLSAGVKGREASWWWSEVSEEMVCDWADMTESLTVTCGPLGPAAPQPEFKREKQSLTLPHWFNSLFLLAHSVEWSDWRTIMITFFFYLFRFFFSVCLLIVSSKTQYMVFCFYCDIFDFLLPARLLNCLLIFWRLGLLGKTGRNQCCVIMNVSAVSLR